MSKQEIHHPDKQADTGAYSAGVLCDGWLYVSGHASLDVASGELLPGSVAEETQRTLEHIETVVRAAGGTLDDIVKCTVHLSNINDFAEFNNAYATYFKDVKARPARTTVGSQLPGIKVEIDAIARIAPAGGA